MEQDSTTGQPGLFEDYIQHTPATTGQRFLNWLIDNALMQFGLARISGTAVGYIIGKFFPDYARHIIDDSNAMELLIMGYAIGVFNYLVYYTICEKAFRGHTLGKLLTGTRAIRDDGQELSFKDALLRSLSRLVPFEVLSGFGERPWHDAWTKTTVIKTR
jgi:uncharacterized RDD family membrane protein YckC